MNLLVVSATDLEIKPFIESYNTTDVLITGVGIPVSIFHLTRRLIEKRYDLIIQAGIAGSFDKNFKKGSVVIVKKDTFGDIGIDEDGKFSTLFDLGFGNRNEFPFRDGWLFNDNKYIADSPLPVVNAITVNKITDDERQVKQLREKFNADIETMEGAAFHYVCLQQKINFLQLRSISNVAGERDKTKWEMKEAISNLTIELKKLSDSYRIQNFT